MHEIQFNQFIIKLRIINNNNKYIENKQMRKQVILIMEGNQYPFGQADESSGKSKIQSRILVRKKHETRSLQERNQLLDKIQIVRNISNVYNMRIDTVLEEQTSIHILYEYVPNSLIKKLKTLSNQVIEKLRDQLLDFGVNLAEIGVLAEWDLKNIGINQKMDAKYYLDLQRMKIDNKMGRTNIQKIHFQNIISIFAQFQGNSPNKKIEMLSQSTSLLYARQASSIDSKYKTEYLQRLAQGQNTNMNNTKKSRQVQQNIQQKQTLKKNEQKAAQSKQMLNKQAQNDVLKPMRKSRTNWKELDQNSQFLQDFINVLDDKSQNAQSKYISDDELEPSDNGVEEREHNQIKDNKNGKDSRQKKMGLAKQIDNQQQQIVWMSAPERHEMHGNTFQKNHPQLYQVSQMYPKPSILIEQKQKQAYKDEEQQQQIVWVDYRDFKDIRERAYAAIRRSSNALQVFRSIIDNYK